MSATHSAFTFPALGILGGGQLGKMLCQHASRWSLPTSVLDVSRTFPAASVCDQFVEGDFTRYEDVLAFGRALPVLTIEIESVNSEALHALAEAGVEIHPHPAALDIIKDKALQKAFYLRHDLPTSQYITAGGLDEVKDAIAKEQLRLPFVLKKRKDGYDGRGVKIIRSSDDLEDAFDVPCIAEELVDIAMELSVIVARNTHGEIRSYPPVGMTFHPDANLVEFLFCPSGIGPALEHEAIQIAQATAEAFGISGLLAVEMFLTDDGKLLINEVAPRPHNSGHHTIEACNVSQYEQHLRAVMNLPLADITLRAPAVMINLLGEPGYTGPVKYRGLQECLRMKDTYIHLYGKATTTPWRKMGHVTILAKDIDVAMKKATFVKDTFKVIA